LISEGVATPPALWHDLKHNHVSHEHIIVLTVAPRDAPRKPDKDRAAIERLSHRLKRISLRLKSQ
jgi:KUP system potassium uptake protein